jgi:hypothetical protein
VSKKNHKNPLSEDQREALDKLHNAQITLEVALTIFVLAFFTINLSTAFPGYGIVALLAMGFSGLLIFICSIIITSGVHLLKRLQSPVASHSLHVRRWLLVTWLCIPLIIFFLILTGSSQNAQVLFLYLILTGIAALLMLAAIVCSLVGIHLIWKRFSKKKKRTPVRLISYGIIAFGMLILTLLGSYTTTEPTKYSSVSVTDSNLELGQTEIKQVGKDGQKQIKRSLIFGTPLSTSNTDPVDELIAKGSRRYQYMYCSNGSYRYYSAEQFKDPSVGFTHQSPDNCAENGAGTQTTIADVPPPEKIVQQVPTYRSPTYTTCTESYFGSSFTCRSY